jgi:hypothetical protein
VAHDGLASSIQASVTVCFVWQAIDRQNLRKVIRNKAFKGTWKDLSDMVLPVREPYLIAQQSPGSAKSFQCINSESFSSPLAQISLSSQGHRDWKSALATAREKVQIESENLQGSNLNVGRENVSGEGNVGVGDVVSPADSKSLGIAEGSTPGDQGAKQLLEDFISLLGFDHDTGESQIHQKSQT